MQSHSLKRPLVSVLGCLMALCYPAAAHTQAPATTQIPPAPIVFRWPDPAFLPEFQCHGAYTVSELEQYLPRAEVALALPSTRTVAVDAERRCLTVTVESIGGGRLAELTLRGVAVPREAVLLLLVD